MSRASGGQGRYARHIYGMLGRAFVACGEPRQESAVEPLAACDGNEGAQLSRWEAFALLEQLRILYEDDANAWGKQVRFEIGHDPAWSVFTIPRDAELPDRDPGFWIFVSDGLLNAPGLTSEILAYSLCHELGHVFGGFPFIAASDAAEGQADYYAGKECLPRLFRRARAQNAEFRATVRALVKTSCDQAWSSPIEQDLCYRIADAGEQALQMIHRVLSCPSSKAPELLTPERTVISETLSTYPTVQCRLDTVFAGALCDVKAPPLIVPGLTPDGKVESDPERAAAPYACATGLGARPGCWFSPSAR